MPVNSRATANLPAYLTTRICLTGIATLLAAGGCSSADSTSDNSHSPAAQAAANVARGQILGEDGQPISAPGARIYLALEGVADASSERLQYNIAVKPDGTYEQTLADGSYHYTIASVELPYHGQNYRLDLAPVEETTGDRSASDGIVQNYVWRISGPTLNSTRDPARPNDWRGGHVSVRPLIYREDLKQAVTLPPPGTKYALTLTPQGPLIDGREGQPIAATLEWTAEMSVTSTLDMHDVPLGVYQLTGEMIDLAGERTPVVFEVAFAQMAPAFEVMFAPDRIMNATQPVVVSVDAAAP